ncbi:MAG: hypothetical protein ACJ77M_10020 [Thermoleophilaceae bacterium]
MVAALPVAATIGFLAVNFSALAAGLLALYLGVMFQTFGMADRGRPGTPFGSGLSWANPDRHRWKNAGLVVGAQVAFLGGSGFALVETADFFVAGAAAFMAILVGMRQMLWALRQAADGLATAHANGVLNCAFSAPFVAGVLTVGLVAVL